MSKRSYQREYRKNMTDEQKQRYKDYRIKYKENMTKTKTKRNWKGI